MLYFSTRDENHSKNFKNFSDVVLEGLAPDGGLYIPERIPTLSFEELQAWSRKDYMGIAAELLQLYAPELSDCGEELLQNSKRQFRDPNVTPLKSLAANLYIGELFHGPTYAFKDVALQFLGQVFQHLLQERGEKLVLLGATSGDTGGAAIYGVRGMSNIQLTILHPHNCVSEVQRKQMCSVLDKNIYNIAVRGNFDQCQSMVKEIMALSKTDPSLPKVGSINSINWGRILAQMSYYFALYFALFRERRELEFGQRIRFVVPTGNFGNVLAGYFVRRMGLPIDLVVASNQNDILHRCIGENRYQASMKVAGSHAPAMDIVQPSNFERYLWYLYGKDVAQFVHRAKAGELQQFPAPLLEQIRSDFGSGSAVDSEILEAINDCHQRFGYLLDPHTACAYHVWRSLEKEQITICLATAHPAKFPEAYHELSSLSPERPSGLNFDGREEHFSVMGQDTAELLKYLRQNVWRGFI